MVATSLFSEMLVADLTARYIPPFKLARLQEDIEDKTSLSLNADGWRPRLTAGLALCWNLEGPEFQKQAWEALRPGLLQSDPEILAARSARKQQQ